MAIQTKPKIETITGEQLAALGNIGRCELVQGRTVMLSPTGSRHGRVESNFDEALKAFVRPRQLGIVMVGEVGIYTHRNPDTVRDADVLFISNERAAKLSSSSFLDVAPDLIVEVLSPEDRWTEVTKKLHEYFAIGVRLVWVADPEEGIVQAYRSPTNMKQFTAPDTLTGDEVLPGLSVPVATLFKE